MKDCINFHTAMVLFSVCLSMLLCYSDPKVFHVFKLNTVTSTKLLKEGDIKEIQTVLWDARFLWKQLGHALTMETFIIESIASSNHNKTEDCFKEMLLKWLRTPTFVPCWKLLADALQSPAIGAHVEEESTGVFCMHIMVVYIINYSHAVFTDVSKAMMVSIFNFS